jgi:hypothetical protein
MTLPERLEARPVTRSFATQTMDPGTFRAVGIRGYLILAASNIYYSTEVNTVVGTVSIITWCLLPTTMKHARTGGDSGDLMFRCILSHSCIRTYSPRYHYCLIVPCP